MKRNLKISVFTSKMAQFEEIYLSSPLNYWQPNDENFKLNFDRNDGFYKLEFAIEDEDFEFKFTKGTWESEEVNHYGMTVSNFIFDAKDNDEIFFEIGYWKDNQIPVNCIISA